MESQIEKNAQLLERYKNDLVATSGKLSDARDLHLNTSLHYLLRLNEELDWSQMSTEDAKLLYSQLLTSELADSTRAIRSRYILGFMRYLCEEKINLNMDYSTICKLKAHRAKPPVIDEAKILTESQVKDVLGIQFKTKTGRTYGLPDEMKVIISFLFGAGMRIGEVLRLKKKDVVCKRDFDSGREYIRISVDDQKTEKRRTTIINRSYLINHVKYQFNKLEGLDENVNFLTGTYEEVKYSYIRYWFGKLQKNGYPILTSHKGRAHNISKRIANGEPIASVSMTTHGSPNAPALKHYLRLNESDIVRNMMKYG